MFPLNLTEFSEIFNTPQILLYLGISALNALLLFLSSMKFLLVLQQCGYRGKRFFKWLDNKETPYKSRLMLLCLLAFLFFCVLNTCFSPLMGRLFETGGKTASDHADPAGGGPLLDQPGIFRVYHAPVHPYYRR